MPSGWQTRVRSGLIPIDGSLRRRQPGNMHTSTADAGWLLIPEDGQDQPVAAAWIAGRQSRSR